jgi:DNA recombination protein RmuC
MIDILLIIIIVLVVANILIQLRKKDNGSQLEKLKLIENAILKFDIALEKNEKSIKDEFQRNRQESNQIAKENREELAKTLKTFGDTNSTSNKDLNDLIRQKFGDFDKQQTNLNKQATENLKDIKETIEKNLKAIRDDNTKQLNEMRKTVDEKLQTTLEKRLGEAFKQVSDRLEQVHKGLGEMQNIAIGVGDLKKVLSNVKTRGVLGEYHLENILEQILTPDQYAKNVATKKGSQANVEFAIKLPGKESEKEVWLPIDSKFPIEDYDRLLDAFDKGDKVKIESSQKVLIKKIESFAKNISAKYIDPPHTTDFCIMFLPVESLYAEVLRHPGLFEILQRKYKITVTGPTTLSALLNSLQMGFRTLAVQKRSSEVWDILKAVKFEFKEFSGVLTKVHKQLNTASGTLETLRTTRTNVMERKLKDVETFTSLESKEILELPDSSLSENANNE